MFWSGFHFGQTSSIGNHMSNEEVKPLVEAAMEGVSSAVPKKKKVPLKGTPERRAYDTAQKKKSRTRQRNEADSETKIKPKEAVEILLERGLRNQHVIDFCVNTLALTAHRNLGVSYNRHLFSHGLRAALNDIELPEVEDREVEGEILHRRDLYALWDFGFWRQPDVPFEQWLADRRRLKSSAYELSKLLGKEDFGGKHEEWTAFAPRWNPAGLHPEYTQREALAWLDSQRSDIEGDKKRYLLVASRNSMKSTWARIHALCLTIICPDASVLVVSETNKLSKKAMKEFKGYVQMLPNNPTLFQQYFGEATVPADDSGQSQTYENPLAHLGLPQSACESSSMESANTGSRFWYCIFDDPISRDNGTANEEQRVAAIAKHGSIMKLREPAGYSLNVQTPWCPGDLGDVMIKRNEEDPERPLAVRIDPVMEIKPEARKKNLLELTEEDVVLNFLPKLNWRFVRDEMRSPEGINFFKAQYMTQWVEEDEGLKCQFEHDELWHRVRPSGFFGSSFDAQTWMSLDRAYSVSKYSDLSALIVGKIQPVESRNALVIVDCKMERLKESDLVKKTVDLIIQHRPTVFIAEKDKNWEDFWQSVVRGCALRGTPTPYFRWINIDNTEKAFARRAKALELPLSDGRLWFANAFPQLEQLLLQFERFDGRKRSGSSIGSKDDGVSALSLMWAEARSLHQAEVIKDDAEEADRRRIVEEAETKEIRKREQYSRIFGNDMYVSPPPRPEPAEQKQAVDPRLKLFGKGKWRM
jgi:hypothetical protein